MTREERLERHDQTLQHLVDKGQLVLTVNVANKEQAEEIIEWMYAPQKPMKSELIDLAWDKATVSKKESDLLEQIKAVLLDS